MVGSAAQMVEIQMVNMIPWRSERGIACIVCWGPHHRGGQFPSRAGHSSQGSMSVAVRYWSGSTFEPWSSIWFTFQQQHAYTHARVLSLSPPPHTHRHTTHTHTHTRAHARTVTRTFLVMQCFLSCVCLFPDSNGSLSLPGFSDASSCPVLAMQVVALF